MLRSHCESDTCILCPSGVERCSHYGVGWKLCFPLRVYLTNLVPRDSHLPAPDPGNMVDTSLDKISRLGITQKLPRSYRKRNCKRKRMAKIVKD